MASVIDTFSDCCTGLDPHCKLYLPLDPLLIPDIVQIFSAYFYRPFLDMSLLPIWFLLYSSLSVTVFFGVFLISIMCLMALLNNPVHVFFHLAQLDPIQKLFLDKIHEFTAKSKYAQLHLHKREKGTCPCLSHSY